MQFLLLPFPEKGRYVTENYYARFFATQLQGIALIVKEVDEMSDDNGIDILSGVSTILEGVFNYLEGDGFHGEILKLARTELGKEDLIHVLNAAIAYLDKKVKNKPQLIEAKLANQEDKS